MYVESSEINNTVQTIEKHYDFGRFFYNQIEKLDIYRYDVLKSIIGVIYDEYFYLEPSRLW